MIYRIMWWHTASGLLAGVLFLLGVTVVPADDAPGAAWRLVRGGGGLTSPQGTTGMTLRSVASNGEIFVVVGDAGTIAHSSDGNRWVEAGSFGVTNWLKDVIWGNDRFVAVGDYTIIHSSEGESWQSARQVVWDSLVSVAWGNGRFVAVGDGGTVVLSDDGIQWREAQEGVAHANLGSVAWGRDRFVAVGDDGMIVHSVDGDRWIPAGDTGTPAALHGVAWSGERFVAVGGDTLLYSSDGDRWLPAGSLAGGDSGWLRDVTWSGGRFVAVGDYAILYSSDGDHWQPATMDIENPLIGVAGSATGLVAVGFDGRILYSSDGIRWDAATGAGAGVPLPNLEGVSWGGDRFVAVAGWTDSIVHSLDGEHWQEASLPDDLYGLRGVMWAGDRFVAVGHSIGLSKDGVRWRGAHMPVHGYLAAVAWNGERHVAVGNEGLILYSNDGGWWSPAADSATAETLTGVAWNGERFVAVGHHGAIVHSSDGDHWQPASRPAVPFRAARPDDDPSRIYYYFSGIVWNGERFVAVGWGGNDNLGTVVHSSDGDSWELAADHDYLANEHFEAVAWSGERFVAVSYFTGTIMYSSDGDRWERATETATVDTLEDVTWGNRRFVAVGRNGTIITSP
jgi:hypothetical protein